MKSIDKEPLLYREPKNNCFKFLSVVSIVIGVVAIIASVIAITEVYSLKIQEQLQFNNTNTQEKHDYQILHDSIRKMESRQQKDVHQLQQKINNTNALQENRYRSQSSRMRTIEQQQTDLKEQQQKLNLTNTQLGHQYQSLSNRIENIDNGQDPQPQNDDIHDDLSNRVDQLENREAYPESPKQPSAEAGWFPPNNGYQYRITREKKSWPEAQKECQSYGGDLAAVGMRDIDVRSFIKRMLHGTTDLWIGLNEVRKNYWRWVDGVTGDFHWRDGEPNDHHGIWGYNEDCATIYGGAVEFGSNDDLCSVKYFAICEKRLS